MTKAVSFNPKKLAGRWREGYALDVHTVSSVYLGENQYGHAEYETTRSDVGELLYRLKYRSDQTAVNSIVDAAAKFLRTWGPGVDLVVAVPPTRSRATQPVLVLGEAIAKSLKVPFEAGAVKKAKKATELKDVYDYDERSRLLENAHRVVTSKVAGRNVLLFDDLYRSGATMNAITEALYDKGKVADVFALTITRTRSNR
ncbi:MAG: hypothetical protein A2289_12420 [Deltaproteobacteria bacterium RIFOXYA12_FULL_58_15]|nr:MAG: hypothetical protein A2289_12420 [Deltaproteobacteria bacterium RIFOXYA12_FULL_58_15]OGR13540.1 MAG: hypothetical protein A2341_13640 [Deltaproteobacteria bacterium RIFOXYB12_FULL_58_9]